MVIRGVLLWLRAALLFASVSLASYKSGSFNYSTVPGYFLQDLNTTNATTFDYVSDNYN